MKQKWLPWVLRAIGGIAVVALVAVMLINASGTSDMNAAQQVEKKPISFTQQIGPVDELQKVAENDSYILYANLNDPEVRLLRKSDGAVMGSRPVGMDDMADLKNKERLELSSMLNIRYADRDSNITEVLGSTGSVARKTYAAKEIDGGVRFDFYFENEGFLVPLEVTLTAKGLHASVPLKDIQEASESIKLTEVVVLPNFGAGMKDSGGYAVVPDGSGALIPYREGLSNYSQRIYGDDAAVGKTVGSSETQIARLPVFGMTDTEVAAVAIITDGDARARVAAKTATARNPFTTVTAEFIYRERLLVDISQATFESTQANMFEPGHCELEQFAVEYRMPDTADYVGMANAYRQYLIENKGMTADADSSALQLQVVGGVMHEENILGIPVDRVLPVTSYSDLQEMIQALNQRGVSSLTVDYLYWYKSATESRLSVDMKAENRLGGTKGLKALLDSLTADTNLYFNLNFTDLMQNQAGYTTLYSTAQNVKKEPLMRQYFLMSTYRADNDAARVFLLNPAKLTDLIAEWTKTFTAKWKDAGLNKLSVGSMGEEIYSHFGDDPKDRGTVQGMWEQTLNAVKEQSGNDLLFTAANAYALPYADTVQSVPTEHSRSLCEERSIPFYSIALHGLVDMSVAPVNDAEGNLRVLQAVESGIGLTYTLGWRNTDQLKNTAGEKYNFINAADWLDVAAQQQKDIAPYLAAVANKAVTAHVQLAEGVYRTTFEGGVWSIVNYTAADYVADGITVTANGYVTGGY